MGVKVFGGLVSCAGCSEAGGRAPEINATKPARFSELKNKDFAGYM